MSDSKRLLGLAVIAGGGYLIYLLSPVLTPFVVGAVLAYIGDPLADRLEGRGLSRAVSVVTVFLLLFFALLLMLLVLLPMLERQVALLISKLPAYLEWLQRTAIPWLGARLGLDMDALDLGAITGSARDFWQQTGGAVRGALNLLSRSGGTLVVWLTNLLLIPVVTFYLLRDWDRLVERIQHILPRHWAPTAAGLAREADEVLGAFLRGQLLVMLVLGLVYATGLWLVGLNLALLIGMIAGLVSFVPYLGFIVGILAATVAGWLQFQDFLPLLWIALVFGVGQLLEGMWLTPKLVGDRIGLHPVAVIFAIMAGGQLFGFVGVLLALPVASVVMVLLRHAHERYLDSELYARKAD